MKFYTKSVFASLVLLPWALAGCETSNSKKVAYFHTQLVFSEFKGTKEMEKKFKALQDKQKYLLDSIGLEIRTLEAAGKASQLQLNNKKQTYERLLSEFRQNNAEQDQEYTEGLWKQINQYVSEYGKENNYAFIHGANGSGNLMYADTTMNITNEVVTYMNEKYDGK